MTQKKLLIIGYGSSGSQTACQMAKLGRYSVTVLTPFDYMEVPFTMTQIMALGPEAHEKALFPLLRDPGIEFVFGTAKTIDDKSVTTSTGQVIPFDVCVLACGQNNSIYMPNPETETTKELRKANIAKVYDNMKAAKTIVISGGGPLGVETASDIILRNKDKKVILVHGGSTVASTMGYGIPESATKTLQHYGIELILNDKVQQYISDKACVELQSGKTISCNCYIPAFSSRQGNCKFLPAASQDSARAGYAKVDDCMRVSGFLNVFAVGDCSTLSDVKTMSKVNDHVAYLVTKILPKILDGRGETLTPYVPGFPEGLLKGPMVMSLGHDHPDAYGFGPDIPGFTQDNDKNPSHTQTNISYVSLLLTFTRRYTTSILLQPQSTMNHSKALTISHFIS